jgi:hypothetical protein
MFGATPLGASTGQPARKYGPGEYDECGVSPFWA